MTIFNTGGTFNKRYDPVSGELRVPRDNLAVEAVIGAFSEPVRVEGLIYKDSLEMDAIDRQVLADALAGVPDYALVVVHGTDTMDITAAYLDALALHKVIVLTGAMVPFSIDPVEATANLAMALGTAHSLQTPGIYICMQGVVGPFDEVRKNRDEGKFERVPG